MMNVLCFCVLFMSVFNSGICRKRSQLLEQHYNAVKLHADSARGARRRNESTSRDAVEEISTEDLVRTLSLASGQGEDRYKQPSAMFLLELYRRLQHGDDLSHASGNNDDDAAIRHSNTVRSFTAKVQDNENRKEVRLSFNLSSVSLSEVIRRAEIRIKHIKHTPEVATSRPNRRHRYRVRVAIYKDDVKVAQRSSRVTVRQDVITDGGFITLDITEVLSEMLAVNVDDTSGMVVEISIRRQKSRRGRRERSLGDDTSYQPEQSLLVMYSKDNEFFLKFQRLITVSGERSVRLARSADDVTSGPRAGRRRKGRRCRSHDFFVDFDQIGWGKWIIYPTRFNAFHCRGRCRSPVTWKFNPTNHAVMQSLMRIKDKNIPRPCCVPTKLKPISMLYYERDEIVVRHHEEMIASRCGCR